jgi:hypothetical protein
MHLTEQTRNKWKDVLDFEGLPKINSAYKRSCMTQLLENQESEGTPGQDVAQILQEAPTNFSGGLGAGTNVASFDPVLISLVRRAMPKLIAYDVCSVQPMSGPTGLIFAMRAKYVTGEATLVDEPEALFNEALTAFSGSASDGTVGKLDETGDDASDPSVMMDSPAGDYKTGTGMTTLEGEALGGGGEDFAEMGFTIERVTVTAKSRKLKAEYSLELAQDMKKIHGLETETELANILSTEIMFEINREVIRTIYITSKIGAQSGTTAGPGTFDLDIDSNGRWSVERFKGLLFHIEREANAIARETRRRKGNLIMCSSDVASALAMAGKLDYNPALQNDIEADDGGSTFAGTLNGLYRVYIDPYFASAAGNHFLVVGYRGESPYDSGLFYCPYVPLQMVRATGESNFQPRIGFATRYGLVSNPYAHGLTPSAGALTANANVYYRKIKIKNLM